MFEKMPLGGIFSNTNQPGFLQIRAFSSDEELTGLRLNPTNGIGVSKGASLSQSNISRGHSLMPLTALENAFSSANC